MADLTISLDEDLMRQIKTHPWIDWSEAAREGLRRRLREIHVWDELLKASELTAEEASATADKVDGAMARRLQDLAG